MDHRGLVVLVAPALVRTRAPSAISPFEGRKEIDMAEELHCPGCGALRINIQHSERLGMLVTCLSSTCGHFAAVAGGSLAEAIRQFFAPIANDRPGAHVPRPQKRLLSNPVLPAEED